MSRRNYYTEFVKINGIDQFFLHYPVDSRIVVIFLHGGPGQSEIFFSHITQPQIRFCSIVYYDQRGTGKTQTKNKSLPHDISIETLLDDLKETVKYIRSKYTGHKIVLLGHSRGSILAIEYIKRYPLSVAAYIGMGQIVDMLGGESIGYKKLESSIKSKGNARHMRALHGLKGYPYHISKNDYTKIALKLSTYGYTSNVGALLKQTPRSPLFSIKDIKPFITCMKTNKNLMSMLTTYSTKDYTEYSLPIFFICGKNDWQIPSILVKKYFDTIHAPDKELFWIENAGHLTDVDNPFGYSKALEAICAKL